MPETNISPARLTIALIAAPILALALFISWHILPEVFRAVVREVVHSVLSHLT